jgi:hypothetical protein
MQIKALFSAIALLVVYCAAQSTQQWTQVKAAGYTQLATSGQSKLYTVQILNGYQYKWPVYVVDLHGSHFQMGYDYGVLLGVQAKDNYLTFFQTLLGSTFLDAFKLGILEDFLDWQVRFTRHVVCFLFIHLRHFMKFSPSLSLYIPKYTLRAA